MCEPVTIGLAVVAVVGAAVTAYGQVQQGKAQQKAANYSSAVARNNQIIADRAAADAIERGKVEASLQQRATAALQARQRVAFAANGVVVDQGSASDIVGDTAELGKFEELRIRNNAAREALGFQTQGMNFGAEAGLQTYQGAAAAQAGRTAAAGTLISSVGSVAGKWTSSTPGSSAGLLRANQKASFDVNYNPSTRNLF